MSKEAAYLARHANCFPLVRTVLNEYQLLTENSRLLEFAHSF